MGNTSYYTSGGYDYEKTGSNIQVDFTSTDTALKTAAEAIHLACTSVKPAGMSIGKFDISTNANTKFKEYAGEDLADTNDITLTCAFNLGDYNNIATLIGQPLTVTLKFMACANRKKARQITYTNAFIMSFEPGDMSANNFPTATMTISTGGDDHTNADAPAPYGTVADMQA